MLMFSVFVKFFVLKLAGFADGVEPLNVMVPAWAAPMDAASMTSPANAMRAVDSVAAPVSRRSALRTDAAGRQHPFFA